MSDYGRRCLFSTTVLTALSFVASERLAAQNDTIGDTTSLQTFCTRDKATLAHSGSRTAYIQAISNIQSCGALAGEVLAEEWRRPPTDSASLMVLAFVSGGVRDRRIYDAARDVAVSLDAAPVTRLAAIAALAAHADASVRLSYFVPAESSVGTNPGVRIERLTHLPATGPWGPPLPESAFSDVVSLLSRLGDSDPDARVRTVAAYVAKRMRAHAY